MHELPIHERILVVDDDRQVLTLLERILARAGYRCTVAGSAEDASAHLDRAPYDLLLCDVQLPGEPGIDFVERALARDPRLAALMISGLDDVTLADRALAIGAFGYVVKPFTSNDVLIAVLGALSRRRHDRDAEAELRASREETIQRLCIAVEARDPDTATHITEMSGLARRSGCPASSASCCARPASCTTSARSASPTRSCSSPARSPPPNAR